MNWFEKLIPSCCSGRNNQEKSVHRSSITMGSSIETDKNIESLSINEKSIQGFNEEKKEFQTEQTIKQEEKRGFFKLEANASRRSTSHTVTFVENMQSVGKK